MENADNRTPLKTRLLAIIVLAVCGWVLLKLVIGVLASIATVAAIVIAVVGVVWALSKL